MSTEEKTIVVPKLRFPEFRGAEGWERSFLGDFSEVVRGGSPRPIDGFLTTAVDGLNWLKIGDVDKEAKYVTHTKEKVRPEALSKTRVVSPGDLILSNSMSFGRPYILQIKTCIHDGWIAITKIAKKAERDFLYYWISAPISQSYFVDNAAGSGVQNLNADIIKALPVCFPSPTEQKKIADCLNSLDELIATQGRKVEALKTHKKGLMQQLFPREGETQPRLRLPEFRDEGEWVLKPLGELVELQSGFAFSSSNFGSEGRKLVTPKNFTKHGHGNFDVSVSKFTTEEVPHHFICKPGDLLVLLTDLTPTCELLGKPLLLENRDGTVMLNQRVVKIEPSVFELKSVFLKYVFLTERYSNRIIKTATGSTVKHSSNRVLQEIPLSYPGLPEQQSIANCLASLDDLIATSTQELAALKTHKRGLMEQLFPLVKVVNA